MRCFVEFLEIKEKESTEAEKRRNGRIRFNSEIRLESLTSNVSAAARLFNYSRGGLYFESDAFIKPGSIVFAGVEDSPYADGRKAYECHRLMIKWRREVARSVHNFGYGAQHLDPIGYYSPEHDRYYYDIPRHIQKILKEKRNLRHYNRIDASRVVYLIDGNRFFEGLIRNFSKEGLFVQVAAPLGEGRRVKLIIPHMKINEGWIIEAEIIRKTANGFGLRAIRFLRTKSAGQGA